MIKRTALWTHQEPRCWPLNGASCAAVGHRQSQWQPVCRGIRSSVCVFNIGSMPRQRVREPFVQLTEFERGRIVGMREAGWTYRRIAQHMGREVSTVHRCCRQWSAEGAHARRPGSGQRRRTDARQDRRILRSAVLDRTVTSQQIRDTVAPGVSARTIRNRLHEAGLRSRVPLGRLPLTPQHRSARLQWCRDRRLWKDEWRRVVFSDESRFCLGANDGRTRVWRRAGERRNQECIRQRHTGPTPGIMVWGAISYTGRTPLVIVEGTLNSARYIQTIIEPIVLPFMDRQGDLFFQQDNARPHVSRATQHALADVRQLPWPSRSPDLSPIEHVWDWMKRHLTRSARPAQTLVQLRHQVEIAWQAVPQDYIQHLYDRLHGRIAACIAAKGGYTRY